MPEEEYTEDCCNWIKDKSGNRYFIPGCMGGAVHGPDGCTCEEGSIFKIDTIIEELRDLRTENSKLRSRVEKLEIENRQLRAAIKPRIQTALKGSP